MYINGTKLHFGATEIKSKANTPTWHDGPCLLRLQPERDFFRAVSVFFVTQTIFNNLVLCQGLGLRFWVLLTETYRNQGWNKS